MVEKKDHFKVGEWVFEREKENFGKRGMAVWGWVVNRRINKKKGA